MKLDANMLRYLSKEDFRVLTAVEMGQKNHEMVPTQLVSSISGLRHGGSYKVLKTLLRHKLLHHENKKYDGYRLTTLGYDYLALRALCARGVITGVGRQIGVGKESDVYEVVDEDGNMAVCKFHRLGRTSFRAIKSKRDYLRHRQNYSWLYLSRLAALKEFTFMRALQEQGLPVPEAIDHNRHCVVMSIIDARPLSQVIRMKDPEKVYRQITQNMVNLAKLGLVHCDFNEFNIMIDEDEDITVIDFPQMVSVRHRNAEHLFQRDVDCIVKFFSRKVKYSPDQEALGDLAYPTLEDVMETMTAEDEDAWLDRQLRASGFNRKFGPDGSADEESDSPQGEDEDDSSEGEEGEEEEEEDGGVAELGEDLDRVDLRSSREEADGGAEASSEGGDLDGLLLFAQEYDKEDETGGGTAGEEDSEGLEVSSSSSHPPARQRPLPPSGGHGPPKSKTKSTRFAAKPKSRTNSNKDKSGRRHDGVKHKMRVSKSDY